MMTTFDLIISETLAAALRCSLPRCRCLPSLAPSRRKGPAPAGNLTPEEEIQQFCTNIADAARDQRYLLQKQELERLQADIDYRIATLEKRARRIRGLAEAPQRLSQAGRDWASSTSTRP